MIGFHESISCVRGAHHVCATGACDCRCHYEFPPPQAPETTESIDPSPAESSDSVVQGVEEWMCYSPKGWSTSGMGRITDEAGARAQYAAELDRLRHDSMIRDPAYRAQQCAALVIRSRIVTEWQTEAP